MENNIHKKAFCWPGTVAFLLETFFNKELGINFIFISRLIDIATIHFFTIVTFALVNDSPVDYYLPSLSAFCLPFILFTIITRFNITALILDKSKYRIPIFFTSLLVALMSIWFISYTIESMQELGSSMKISKSAESLEKEAKDKLQLSRSSDISQPDNSVGIHNEYIKVNELTLDDLDEGSQNIRNNKATAKSQ